MAYGQGNDRGPAGRDRQSQYGTESGIRRGTMRFFRRKTSKATANPRGWMRRDHLFILYTCGSTGKPRGVLNSAGGYLLFRDVTFKWIFDYHNENVQFRRADIGWVTGHSYGLYGPLSAGATSLMFEGIPTYPDPSRFWGGVDKHQVKYLLFRAHERFARS